LSAEHANSAVQVDKLNTLFNEKFNYDSTVLRLHDRRDPQFQLHSAIGNLVDQHDGPPDDNLLIVYYSGHGEPVPNENNDTDLFLSGFVASLHRLYPDRLLTDRRVPNQHWRPQENERRYDAHASWLLAERDLDLAKADVLIILDCCAAASIITKGAHTQGKVHQLLAACGHNQFTEKPGPRSFTKYLLEALEEEVLNDKFLPFTPDMLNDVIVKKRKEITRNQSHVFFRHPNGRNRRHIILAPVGTTSFSDEAPRRTPNEAAHVDLRLGLRNATELSDEETAQLAKTLHSAVKASELDITSVQWLNISRGTRFSSAVEMVMTANRKKKLQKLISPTDQLDQKKRAAAASLRESKHMRPIIPAWKRLVLLLLACVFITILLASTYTLWRLVELDNLLFNHKFNREIVKGTHYVRGD
jgi:hypothetical protein